MFHVRPGACPPATDPLIDRPVPLVRTRRRWLGALLGLTLLLGSCQSQEEPPQGPQVEGEPIGVAGAHEHGVVRVGLAVDGRRVLLDAEVPAEALFGFERAPETDEERSAVRGTLERIREDGGTVLSFDEAVGCVVESATVDAPAAFHGEEDEDEHGHDDHDHDDADHLHLEVEFEVRWSCRELPEGTFVTLRVKDLIPEAERVDLTVVTAGGSAAARLGTSDRFRL